MASINTNLQAITALQSLKGVQSSLQTTQSRISTGLKVQDARDNAAYFSLASTMKGDAGVLNAIRDNLAVVGTSVGTARQGAEAIQKSAQKIAESIAAATADQAVDKTKFQDAIKAEVANIKNVLDNTSFNGQNLLKSTDAVTVVTGISREGATYATTTFTYNQQDLSAVHTALAAIDVTAAADPAALGALLQTATAQVAAATNAATALGSAQNTITGTQDFVGKLVDNINAGVGAIVDADMNQEAARLQALQVQEQLAMQSLSIANQAPQSILSLFRN
ncbi:flagellin [Inquilinus sp. NPDC058860]|uniref:flagellin N-terminal helical domain-containing protein n=1 Tax=Inquilinus sp. NPDC058860 TaxID=3346652 RepID=UPI003696FA64